MSTALALRLEFAMRSLEIYTSANQDAQLDARIEILRRLVDQAIEELSS